MAIVKKDTIVFSNGREITAPGGIISITRTLELSDYYSRNVFFLDSSGKVINIYQLTKDELIEIADLMIQLWMELKDNVRQADITSPTIFKTKGARK
ncbi:hypothetical protein [Chitinophaga sp. 212800010-3]|uniref:hypothetical protein n=1 Tax=unclassified Chitinophaga TaxID=2619133 RepID=UPI002DF0FC67|nr:AbrB/MazE/SpoVT family DNA-binding domain-containing protein [Chitinophaga sp. 212800010-3]